MLHAFGAFRHTAPSELPAVEPSVLEAGSDYASRRSIRIYSPLLSTLAVASQYRSTSAPSTRWDAFPPAEPIPRAGTTPISRLPQETCGTRRRSEPPSPCASLLTDRRQHKGPLRASSCVLPGELPTQELRWCTYSVVGNYGDTRNRN